MFPKRPRLKTFDYLGRADLRKCVAMCKQKSAHAYSQTVSKPLWQASFYDHVLRDDETDLFVIRYILENPVRAGLVERCEDYPFVGCSPLPLEEMLRIVTELPQ